MSAKEAEKVRVNASVFLGRITGKRIGKRVAYSDNN